MDNELNNQNNVPSLLLKDYTVKPLFQKRGVDLIVTAALVLLSIAGVSAVFWNYLSLGYTLVSGAAFILISLFVFKKAQKINIPFLICGILSLVCSCSYFLTSNAAVKILTFLATIVSSVIWFSSAAGKEYSRGDYNLLVYAFTAVYRAASDLPRVLKSIFSKSENKSKTVSNILIGVACSIPVVLIVVPLLINADEAFSALMSGIIDDYFSLAQKVFSGLVVSIGLAALVFSLKYNDEQYKDYKLTAKINNATVSAFLGVLCLVYIVYLFSQLAYFFSAFSSILPKGYKFTYAAYARRGFFELCIIAFINLLMIYAAVIFSDKKEGRIPLAVKLPSIFIVLFTFVTIVTSISKMVMYIGAYGCTVLRIGTSAFMIWMFIFFIGILIRLFVKKFDVLIPGLILALVILAVLGIFNINAKIAEYNYNAYKTGKLKIDVNYMADLGDEGIPYLYKLTKDKDADTSNRAKAELSLKYYNYYDFGEKITEDIKTYKEFSKLEKSQNNFGAYSVVKSKAYETLDKYAKEQNGNIYTEYEIKDTTDEY